MLSSTNGLMVITVYLSIDLTLDPHWLGLAAFGIGVHHAGLSMDDRRATEDLYLKKVIRVLVATSVRSEITLSLTFIIIDNFFKTLAVGVNLRMFFVSVWIIRLITLASGTHGNYQRRQDISKQCFYGVLRLGHNADVGPRCEYLRYFASTQI